MVKSKSSNSVALHVESDKDDTYPRVIAFPNDMPLGALDLTVGCKGTGKKRKRQIVSNVNGVIFKGCDYGTASSHKNDMCKFAVGKVDSTTGKMTIYPTNHVFVMRPELAKESLEPAKHSGLSLNERRTALTEEFGSRKKKRALQQAESNKIVDDNISGADAVASTLTDSIYETETVVHQDASEYALEQNRKLLLPYYDGNTTVEADAYPLTSESDQSTKCLMTSTIFATFSDMYQSLLPEDITEVKAKKYITTASVAILQNLETAAVTTAASYTENTMDTDDEPTDAGELKTPTIVVTAEDLAPVEAVTIGIRELADKLQECIHADDDSNMKLDKTEANAIFESKTIVWLYINILLKINKIFTTSRFMQCDKEELVRKLGAVGQEFFIDSIVMNFATFAKRRGTPTYTMNKQSVNKLHATILALGLHASYNFSLKLAIIAKTMALPVTNLVKIARTMAGKITKETGSSAAGDIMKLALPLNQHFPGKPRVQAKKR